jgi:hypothetical protein
MKKNIIFLLMVIAITTSSKAQYPCFNGISTNPLNPINTQLPAKKNTFFDWQLQHGYKNLFLTKATAPALRGVFATKYYLIGSSQF